MADFVNSFLLQSEPHKLPLVSTGNQYLRINWSYSDHFYRNSRSCLRIILIWNCRVSCWLRTGKKKRKRPSWPGYAGIVVGVGQP